MAGGGQGQGRGQTVNDRSISKGLISGFRIDGTNRTVCHDYCTRVSIIIIFNLPSV